MNAEAVVTTACAVVINAEIKVNRSPTTQHPATLQLTPNTQQLTPNNYPGF